MLRGTGSYSWDTEKWSEVGRNAHGGWVSQETQTGESQKCILQDWDIEYPDPHSPAHSTALPSWSLKAPREGGSKAVGGPGQVGAIKESRSGGRRNEVGDKGGQKN